jgi:hypothetical protein
MLLAVVEKISPRGCSCTTNVSGITLTIICYIMFAYAYFFTVYYGIWGQAFGIILPQRESNFVVNVVHSVLFSLFFGMTIWSHL